MNSYLESRYAEMRTSLEEKGVAVTPRRGKLLEVLLNSNRHPSVGEIHQELSRTFPGTSLATVYNTIELLKETGQVLEIEFSGAANRYDGKRPQSHPHLICVRCEKIEDLESVEISEPVDAIAAATGYEITHRRTDYYGVCPDCQAEEDGARGNDP